jgi:hypothetical protein
VAAVARCLMQIEIVSAWMVFFMIGGKQIGTCPGRPGQSVIRSSALLHGVCLLVCFAFVSNGLHG